MKLRYLLRGIGIGAILAVVAMYFSYNKPEKAMSDDEIMAKARELGMMTVNEFQDKELDSLKEKEKAEENPGNKAEPAEIKKDVAPAETKKEEKPEVKPEKPKEKELKHIKPKEPEKVKPETPTKPEALVPKPEAPAKPEALTPKASAGKFNFSITAGMSSEKVAASLKAMGLVEDSADFNKFLVNNGYASKIRVGTFELQDGWSYNEIASKLTK